MLGVVMLAAAVPTLPAVSYYLPPRKKYTGTSRAASCRHSASFSSEEQMCDSTQPSVCPSVSTPREARFSSHTEFLVLFVCFHRCRIVYWVSKTTMVIKIYICELIKPKTRPGAYLQCLKTHASEWLFYTPLRFVKKSLKIMSRTVAYA